MHGIAKRRRRTILVGQGAISAALLVATWPASPGCTAPTSSSTQVVTITASTVGDEALALDEALARFRAIHPEIRVERRVTPDDGDARRGLYVQWLAAGTSDPDVLQLDVVWVAQFAAAGWLLPLDRFAPRSRDFVAAAIEAATWKDALFALPWFVDVGLLYRRTDWVAEPPTTLEALISAAAAARAEHHADFGYLWQGDRYEGLVCVFLEHLGAFGGAVLDADGNVRVDDAAGVKALTFLVDAVRSGISPRDALHWHEDETRLAFQRGRAAFLRNWPYAYRLFADPEQSAVAGRFAVSPPPGQPGGHPTSTLGGQLLAINAASDVSDDAYALIAFLTGTEESTVRARRVGSWPARPALYADATLADALPIAPAEAGRIVAATTARPVSPIYPKLSEILQIALHRALTGQAEPRDALADAARSMRRALNEVGLG